MKQPLVFSGNDDNIFAIIETPKGSREKFAFVPEYKLFELTKTLPAGTAFPLDFGFIPRTLAEDGDPLDILIIMNSKTFPGCLVECRVIGGIEAKQTEKGKTIRNDRIIGVPVHSPDHNDITSIKDLEKNFMDELLHFFEYYDEMCGKKFKHLGNCNARGALKLIQKARVKK